MFWWKQAMQKIRTESFITDNHIFCVNWFLFIDYSTNLINTWYICDIRFSFGCINFHPVTIHFIRCKRLLTRPSLHFFQAFSTSAWHCETLHRNKRPLWAYTAHPRIISKHICRKKKIGRACEYLRPKSFIKSVQQLQRSWKFVRQSQASTTISAIRIGPKKTQQISVKNDWDYHVTLFTVAYSE